MPEMTKEERIVCALSCEEPDRVPLYDLVDNTAVIEHYAGQKLTLENARDVIPLALSRAIDTTRVWMPAAPGRRVDERGFIHERVDWFNEWQIGVPFSDMPGLIAFVRSEIDRLEGWQPTDPQGRLAELLAWKEKFRGTVIPASGAGVHCRKPISASGLTSSCIWKRRMANWCGAGSRCCTRRRCGG